MLRITRIDLNPFSPCRTAPAALPVCLCIIACRFIEPMPPAFRVM